MMKKLVLFFSLVFLPVFAAEVEQEPVETHVEKIETAAQVVGVSLAGYGIYQIYQTWNNPESNKLFTDLLNVYKNYLDVSESGISSFNRVMRTGYFQYIETMRQLVLPVTIVALGAEIVLLAVVSRLKRQADAQAQQALQQAFIDDQDSESNQEYE